MRRVPSVKFLNNPSLTDLHRPHQSCNIVPTPPGRLINLPNVLAFVAEGTRWCLSRGHTDHLLIIQEADKSFSRQKIVSLPGCTKR
ncbi:hypothetical protein C8Q76DRAFT_283818 [Earliella scabrosa]|nr:hypothetical protein C8Q76DRAFT_283818 [Earliella scabrosa]